MSIDVPVPPPVTRIDKLGRYFRRARDRAAREATRHVVDARCKIRRNVQFLRTEQELDERLAQQLALQVAENEGWNMAHAAPRHARSRATPRAGVRRPLQSR